MEAITAFLESFDIAKLLPELGSFIGDLRFWAGLFMLIGPIIMLAMGAWYYFLPAREANHHIGFRTHISMGSVEAWRYSQRLAGLWYMVCGGALAVLSLVLILVLAFGQPMVMASIAFIMILLQAIAAVALWVLLQLMIGKKFDKDGNPK